MTEILLTTGYYPDNIQTKSGCQPDNGISDEPLPIEKRAQILCMMAAGVSIRSISRLTGASKNTIAKLLADAGAACNEYQDRMFRELPCKRVQVDEIWSFVYAKQKNVPAHRKGEAGVGDVWTWKPSMPIPSLFRHGW